VEEAMPTRFLSDADLAGLSGYPTEIDDDDLVTFFRLEEADLAWLGREHRGPANRLGLALQLATLPWLGFVPDDLSSAPESAVERLAARLSRLPVFSSSTTILTVESITSTSTISSSVTRPWAKVHQR
jgi:hypothetical protein